MPRPKLALVLGIRPDIIRASLLIKELARSPEIEFVFLWSGQHYSDNLKDVFFRDLDVPRPHVELGATGANDAELVASLLPRLHDALDGLRPDAVVFLGDTNTVMGSLAAAQLNLPIVHIEGCMRSYDWRMPEEKYRTLVDHLSDVIYAYFDEYKRQGVAEGLNPESIVVVGNLIVDVLNAYYFARRPEFERMADDAFFSRRGLARRGYHVMTCHRRENVEDPASLRAIVDLVGRSPLPVYFPAGYRTQRRLREEGLTLPSRVTVVDPVGYAELLTLLVNSRGVLTDSGTVVEEACVLGVPSVQMRKSTERPQVYDAGGSVKFDPTEPARDAPAAVFDRLASLDGARWEHGLGDGHASERIVADLLRRAREGGFRRHEPRHYPLPVDRAFRSDGLAR